VSDVQTDRTSTLELRDYFRILSLRKWTAFLVFAAVVGGALYLSYRQKPVYESEARVLVPAPVVGVSSLGTPIQGRVNTETEAAIADSDTIARPVALALQTQGFPIPNPPDSPDVLRRLQKAIDVAPEHSSDILIMKAQAASPTLAQAIAQQFALQYLDYRRRQSVATLQAEADALKARVTSTQEDIAALGPASQDTPEEANSRVQFQNDLSQLHTQLDPLVKQITDLKASSGDVLSDAQVPSKPARPNHLRDGLLAAIVGLVLGFGAAFLRDYVDDSLRGVEDVERQSGSTLVGVIPHVAGAGEQKRKDGGPPREYLVVAEDSRAPATEAYRTLRTNLLFMSATGPLKVLLITSPLQGEGKSTTAANLAAVMAQAGQRVLLVGADLRRPSLHRFFGLTNRLGLSSVLSGQAELGEAVQDPGIRDLRLIGGGPIPPNPAELLGSPRMRTFLEEVKNVADWVILDGPPALGLADALVLSAVSDGVLQVVNEATNRRVLAHARDQLAKVQARTVGTVLNNFGPSFSYYYSDYYLYSSEYYQQQHEADETPPKLSRRERKRQAALAAEQAVAIASGNGEVPSQNGDATQPERAGSSTAFFSG